MILYSPAGTQIISVEVDDDSSRQNELMGHDVITLRFSLTQTVSFEARSYCIWEGRRYIMFSQPEITKRNSRAYDYVMTLYTYEYWLSIIVMRDLLYAGNSYSGGTKTKFPLTATPREHLEMIANNLNKADGTRLWRVDYSRTLGMTPLLTNEAGSHQNYDGTYYKDDGDMKLVNYENQYCSDAVKGVADIFNTEYEVEEKTLNGTTYHLLCLHKVEYHKDNPLSMKYGKTQGFVSGIVRRNETDTPPLDRIYVQGGEQNIPEHYGQTQSGSSWMGTKENTLMLPKPYNASTNPGGIRNIRYNGSTLYFETVENSYTYYWFNLEKVYKYGLYADNQRGYMDADAEVGGETAPIVYLEPPAGITIANTWKRYEIDDDRRSIYRSNPSSRTPLRSTNVEGFYDGSEVYPMRVGAVSAVRAVDNNGNAYSTGTKYYDIFDGDTDSLGETSGKLNYADCGIPGETMTIIFQDGMLAGREFDIQTIGDGTNVKPNCGMSNYTTPSTYRIPLCQSEQDGIVMPSHPFIPAIGDHYVVFHCSLPESYVTNAEMRMLWQAVDYLYYKDDYTYSFSGNVDEMYAKSKWSDNTYPVATYMAIGQFITVTETDLFGADGQTMRVTSIKQNINNKYDIDISLSNAAQPVFDWAKKLAATVRQVTVRPPHWRPWNHILPLPIHGVNESNEVFSFSDFGTSTTHVPNSRQNASVAKINELIDTVYSTNEVLNDMKTKHNDLVDKIAEYEPTDPSTKIIESTDGYVFGIQECKLNPITKVEQCTVAPSIGIPNRLEK